MNQRISFFGGTTRGTVTLANGHEEKIEVFRDVWFDRDFDGHWLVWAQAHDGVPRTGADDGQVGAIVVRNRDVGAFLEQLGKLIVEPAVFDHEPVFVGVDRIGEATAAE
jgi:hypothetical protein